jgi:exopolysaccharide production protein ExoZ
MRSRLKIGAIQILRAAAANLVVLSHLAGIEAQYSGAASLLPSMAFLGRLGVDIFFVISGFVIAMVASGRPTWQSFLWARLTRIYPIYWFYTAIVLGVAAMVPGAVYGDQAPSVLKSLLLFPDPNGVWLNVGWSLVHEVFFYLVVTVFLALRINLAAGLAMWSIVLLLPISGPGPILQLVLSPMTFEFIAGAAIWLTAGRLIKSSNSTHGLFELLGDASYSVYLSHVMVLSALWKVRALLPVQSSIAEVGFLAGSLLVANLWGYLSFRYLERPVIALSRGEWHVPTEAITIASPKSLSQRDQ